MSTILKTWHRFVFRRRFNNSFLYLIGKLFTNINMDSFNAASDLLLKEFTILVSRTPLPIDAKRLVQVPILTLAL
jgi:aspartyl/asparaginyl beta-hydroxylase (cupin superfamily)